MNARNLTALMAPAAVDSAVLRERYGGLLDLVRTLIGVIPNCDAYLEIWPAAFRSYNVMIPNLLNLPLVLWGLGPGKRSVALALFAASKASGCAYCTAHTCSFALRRGIDPEEIAAAALPEGRRTLAPADRAVIGVAAGIASVPSTLAVEEVAALRAAFKPGDVEWIVLGAAMMGFLNKFMDASGMDLEQAAVDEAGPVLNGVGWTTGAHEVVPTQHTAPLRRGDDWRVHLSVLRHLPWAVRLDLRWTSGVPGGWPAVGEVLRARTGHDFPLLSRLQHGRARRAIATMVRDNCDPESTVLGLPVKYRAGLVYAASVGDDALAADARALATHVDAADLDAATELGAGWFDLDDPAVVDELVATHGTPLVVAAAAAPSPARMTPAVLAHAARDLEPAAIVELLTWLSVLQVLHRLHVFAAFTAT